MAEGVGKVMKILSRVTIPDGAGMETAAEKAKGKPGEKLAPKMVQEQHVGKAGQRPSGEGCIGVCCPGSSFVMEAPKLEAAGWARSDCGA